MQTTGPHRRLVLHRGEEQLGHLRSWVVVHRSGIDIRHLLVEVPFAATNVADALELFLEVAVAALLQSLIIQGKHFLNILMQDTGSPATIAYSDS